MHVYRGPFKFQVEPQTDYYNQFSSQERNIGEDIHSTGPSLESKDDEEFWWMFAAMLVVICFLILLFGLSLQLLARAILRHNQVQGVSLYMKVEDICFFSSLRHSFVNFIFQVNPWIDKHKIILVIAFPKCGLLFCYITGDLQVVSQPSCFVGHPVVEVQIKHLLLISL